MCHILFDYLLKPWVRQTDTLAGPPQGDFLPTAWCKTCGTVAKEMGYKATTDLVYICAHVVLITDIREKETSLLTAFEYSVSCAAVLIGFVIRWCLRRKTKQKDMVYTFTWSHIRCEGSCKHWYTESGFYSAHCSTAWEHRWLIGQSHCSNSLRRLVQLGAFKQADVVKTIYWRSNVPITLLGEERFTKESGHALTHITQTNVTRAEH